MRIYGQHKLFTVNIQKFNGKLILEKAYKYGSKVNIQRFYPANL